MKIQDATLGNSPLLVILPAADGTATAGRGTLVATAEREIDEGLGMMACLRQGV